MAIIKCKMCGGDLNVQEGMTVAECEYCGTKQTVPSADSEKKMTLFARANRLRFACEFDKAAGIYESLVADFPEEAEAYWGLVLCKYGIEYVDDPGTGKKVPTCHRSSYDSVMDDPNFEQAMENADVVAQKVYREEAKQIERIRKGILEVSSQEQPYDIFICYKETAPNGDRTLDSVLAQDLYSALTDKGYRVFFSRITLQGKLGEAYEPYIFAALNSAKVMLAVGTCYEYYNAVWVKNEWSRYLKICEADKSKHLIPCYKDLDPEDMPREFNHLQGADLGKMGAVQDILFNMEKYIPLKKQAATVIQEKVVVGGAGGNKIASLLDRGNMALEDGDWDKADSFFEDVLNNDSKNAQAYLGKTLVQERCRTIDAFARKRKDASQSVQAQTLHLEPNSAHVDEAVKKYTVPGFVEEDTIRKLYDFDLSYSSQAAGRREQYKAEEAYWANHKWLSKAEKFAVGTIAENLTREKKALFAALNERVKQAEAAENAAIKDVQKRYEAHLKQADGKAAQIYADGLKSLENYYQELLQTAKTSADVDELTKTARKFEQLGDYQDSKNLAEHCRKRAAEEQAKLDAEAERQRLLKEKQKKKRKARNKRIAILSAVAAVIVIAALVVTQVVIPAINYNKALALMENGEYEEAIAAFEALGDYKDAAAKIKEVNYLEAAALMEKGEYAEAAAAFAALGDYKDATSKIKDANYLEAAALMENGEYAEAAAAFEALGNYKDAAAKKKDANYLEAAVLMENGGYVEAAAAFAALGDYKDAAAKEAECIMGVDYQEAVVLEQNGEYGKTAIAFGQLGDYRDAKERSLALWEQVTQRDTVSAGFDHTVGLKSDGTVVAVGSNRDVNFEYCGQCDVSGWTDIVAVSAGDGHTVGLKSDGTVVAVGSNEYGECDVSGWTDIVAVSAGIAHTVGLKSDGRVVAVGHNDSGECNVSDWRDIIAVSAGGSYTVGLKSDGTVVAVGWNDNGECDVSGWSDIVAVSAGDSHTVGLKSDGTVVAVGSNTDGYDEYCGQCNVSDWTDIVAVSAGIAHTVGLKSDGTVVAVGSNTDVFFMYCGQCDVSGWTDIIAVSAGGAHTVGLKSDGTVVAVGYNGYSKCDVSGWKSILVPDSE